MNIYNKKKDVLMKPNNIHLILSHIVEKLDHLYIITETRLILLTIHFE